MNKTEQIKEMLHFDPLAVAEKITGKSYKEDEDTIWGGMALQMQKIKYMNKLMDETNDTKFSETEGNYLSVVKSIGFETLCVLPFPGGDAEERLYIMWHPKYSILLKWDTFTYGDDGSWAKAGKSVPPPSRNSANMYYNWSPNSTDTANCCSNGHILTLQALPDFSGIKELPDGFPEEPKWDLHMPYEQFKPLDDEWHNKHNAWIADNGLRKVWIGSHDAREAIRFTIDTMREKGKFLEKWMEQPFMWLLNYSDTKETYDYDAINKERIALFPAEVCEKIGKYK